MRDVARRVEQEGGAAGGAGGQAPAQLHAAAGRLRADRARRDGAALQGNIEYVILYVKDLTHDPVLR